VEAWRRASATVTAGELVGVCGPCGSGKSTSMNLLGLRGARTAGAYAVLGVDTSGLGEVARAGLRARAIGFVFQSFHLLASRTAAENVALGLAYVGVPRRRRAGVARDVLAEVGRSHRVDADVTTMSGGERQRVAIARAVAHEPQLLLADEPTGNLDSATSAQVLDLLARLNRDGLTQVIVTHNDVLAANLARRLDVFDGQLTESRSPAPGRGQDAR